MWHILQETWAYRACITGNMLQGTCYRKHVTGHVLQENMLQEACITGNMLRGMYYRKHMARIRQAKHKVLQV